MFDRLNIYIYICIRKQRNFKYKNLNVMKTLTIKSYSKEFTDQVLLRAHRADRSSGYYGNMVVNGSFLTAIARKSGEYYEIEITTQNEFAFDLEEIFEQFI